MIGKTITVNGELWQKKIVECTGTEHGISNRPAGLMTERQKGITKANYYYRLR